MNYDARFDQFFPRLMKYEGGYINDPDDPGGETKFGISKRRYPKLDIKNLSIDHAKEIYFLDYYLPLKIASFVNEKTAWQVFDFAVNAGGVRSTLVLQKLVGAVADGKIGPKTLAKADTWSDPVPLHVHLIGERIKYYVDLAESRQKYRKFLKGWAIRTLEL